MKTAACVLLFALCAMADVTGKWTVTFTPEGESATQGIALLKQAGGDVTGTVGPSDGDQNAISNGKIEGDRLTFEVRHPNGMLVKIALVIDEDSMKGDATLTQEGRSMKAKLELTRAK
jgi:hypothetical protein